MKSTLYLKFVIVYIIFGFLSLFTIATLGSGLVSDPLPAPVLPFIRKRISLQRITCRNIFMEILRSTMFICNCPVSNRI